MQNTRRERTWGIVIASAFAIAAASCGGGGEGPTGPPAPTVSRVDVAPGTASVIAGQTATFTAQPKDVTGAVVSGQSISWSSANPSIATVSGGVVTAVAAGTTTVIASVGSVQGTAALTVLAQVASVTLSPATASVIISQTLQLAPVMKDAAGTVLTDRTVTWTSSNDVIASVSSTGLVTTKTLGTVTITATVEGKSGTASVAVQPVPVASVTVTPPSSTLIVDATVQLGATTKDSTGATLSGRAVTWSTSDAAVATVSTAGLVTAKAAGSATITATSEGKSGTAAITVALPPVASVTVSPATGSVSPGLTLQLTATTNDASGQPLTGRPVTWTTSDASKATVGSSGVVTGVSPGSVTITATSEGKSGSAILTVADVTAPSFVSVTITPPSVDVSNGAKTVIVSAQIRDAGRSGVSQFSVTATAPTSGPFATCNPASTLTSGTRDDGVWSCTLTIAKGAVGGDWKIAVAATDAAGNQRALGQAELIAANFSTKFTVVSSSPDVTPPVVVALTVTSGSVDVTSGARTVTVSARIQDEAAGSGVASFFVSATAPTQPRPVTNCQAGAPTPPGTTMDGVWSCTLTFPKGATPGDWTLDLMASDAAFNQLKMGQTALAAANFPTKITVVSSTPDQSPPVFTALTLSPSTVDVSTSSQTVTVTAHLTDSNSGVVSFAFSAALSGSTTKVQCGATVPSAGTNADGDWTCTVTIPARAAPGDWLITVTATDAAGFSQTYGPPATVAFPPGFPTRITVVSR